jgi:UDP-glucose 4-epimerase
MTVAAKSTAAQRVLLTGVSGFLGRVLCHQLIQSGYHVTGIYNKNPPTDLTTLPQDLSQLDLTTPQPLAPQSFDIIFHLAGTASTTHSVQAPAQDFAQNLTATFKLLDKLRECSWKGKLVYVSTAAVYGEPQQIPITEETPTKPISPYGVSKLASEEYIRVFSQCYGFRAVIARIFSLYGPRQKKQVIFDILRKTLLSDEPITLFGTGDEVRDFIHVNDAAQALLLLAKQAEIGAPIFNVCSASGISIRELAERLVTLTDQNPERLVFTGRNKSGDPKHWIGCNKKLCSRGFSLNYSLSEGLADTVDWFLLNLPLKLSVQNKFYGSSDNNYK